MKNEIVVQIKLLNEKSIVPKQSTELAGGWDVTVTEIERKDDLVICKLGFAIAIPEGYKLTLVPRSSLTKTKWMVQNSPGLVDADYRGEVQYRFRALPLGVKSYLADDFSEKFELIYPEFPFKVGERIGQVYLEEVLPTKFEVVQELSDTSRGSGGFGSTGK